jgi:hypothetical protein
MLLLKMGPYILIIAYYTHTLLIVGSRIIQWVPSRKKCFLQAFHAAILVKNVSTVNKGKLKWLFLFLM